MFDLYHEVSVFKVESASHLAKKAKFLIITEVQLTMKMVQLTHFSKVENIETNYSSLVAV